MFYALSSLNLDKYAVILQILQSKTFSSLPVFWLCSQSCQFITMPATITVIIIPIALSFNY